MSKRREGDAAILAVLGANGYRVTTIVARISGKRGAQPKFTEAEASCVTEPGRGRPHKPVSGAIALSRSILL